MKASKETSQRWVDSLFGLKRSIETLGRFPMKGEPGAKWLMAQRRRAWMNDMPGWQEQSLNEISPRWKDQLDLIWDNRAEMLKQVVKRLGRLPSQSEECGGWLSKQRAAARGSKGSGRWDEYRESYMNLNFPGWM